MEDKTEQKKDNNEDEILSVLGLEPDRDSSKEIHKEVEEPKGGGRDELVECICDKCGTASEFPVSILGHLEVCPKCKKAMFVTIQVRNRERVKQDCVKLENWSWVLRALGFAGVIVMPTLPHMLSSPEFSVSFPPALVLFSVIAGLSAFLFSEILRSKKSRIESKWAFELPKAVENKRQKVCEKVVELRSNGQDVRLCDVCAGTGFLGYWNKRCENCCALGYIVIERIGASEKPLFSIDIL